MKSFRDYKIDTLLTNRKYMKKVGLNTDSLAQICKTTDSTVCDSTIRLSLFEHSKYTKAHIFSHITRWTTCPQHFQRLLLWDLTY